MKRTTDYTIHLNIHKADFDAARAGGTFNETRTLCGRNILTLLGVPVNGKRPCRRLSDFELSKLTDAASVQAAIRAGKLIPRSEKAVLHRGYSRNTIDADIIGISTKDEGGEPQLLISYKTQP